MKEKVSDIYFNVALKESSLPKVFSILTAYNPLDIRRDFDENCIANTALEKELMELPVPLFRVELYFNEVKSHEPGFASMARLHTLYQIAQSYHQFALYSVDGDKLSLINCNDDEEMIIIPNGFRSRVLQFDKNLSY